jgi:hypothetical protein
MAYDAGILNQEENKTTGTNILGPQTSGQQQPQLQDVNQQQQNPTGQQQMAPAPGGGQQAATIQASGKQPQRRSGPSSGQFTNIRKYLSANRPQAARMAGAVTENTGAQASQVGQAIEQQRQQYSNMANTVGQKQTDFQQFGQGLIQQADTSGQFENEADINKFGDYIKGNTNYLKDLPGQIAQAQQQQEAAQAQQAAAPAEGAQAPAAQEAQPQFDDQGFFNQQREGISEFAKLVGQAQNERGRSMLLKDTFAKPDRQYTAGMTQLDQLLLQGDKDAYGKLISDVTGQKTGLDESLTGALDYAGSRRAALEKARQDIISGLTGDIDTRREGISSAVDEEVKLLNEQRDLLRKATAGEKLSKGEQKKVQDLLNQQLSGDSFQEYLSERQAAADRLKGLDVADLIGQGGWLSNQIKKARDWDPTEGLNQAVASDQQTQQMSQDLDSTRSQLQQVEQELKTRPWNTNAQTLQKQLQNQIKQLTSGISSRRQELEQGLQNPFVRGEQAGQIYNELSRLTNKISNEDLALLGMSRNEMQDMIYKDLGLTHEGKGGGQTVNYANLYNTLENLAAPGQMSEEEARQDMINRILEGEYTGAVGELISDDEITATNVADQQQRARMAALSRLAQDQNYDWAFDQRDVGAFDVDTGKLGSFGNLADIAGGYLGGQKLTKADIDRADRWKRLRAL